MNNDNTITEAQILREALVSMARDKVLAQDENTSMRIEVATLKQQVAKFEESNAQAEYEVRKAREWAEKFCTLATESANALDVLLYDAQYSYELKQFARVPEKSLTMGRAYVSKLEKLVDDYIKNC